MSKSNVKSLASYYKGLFKDALNDWYQILNFIYDPHQAKIKLLKVYEKAKDSPWLFSGNVIPLEIDESYDDSGFNFEGCFIFIILLRYYSNPLGRGKHYCFKL